MTHDIDPAEALAAARRARIAAVERGTSTWWYAPIFGLGMGGGLASHSLPLPWQGFGVVASLAVVLANFVVWRRRTGLHVTTFQGWRTSTVGAVLIVLLLVAMFLSLRLDRAGYEWGPAAVGVAFGVIAAIGSRLWDRAWRAEARAS